MFTEALFTTAKIPNQPRYPSYLADEWIKKMWYIYTMDYSAIKKNKILSFASTHGRNGRTFILSEITQAEKNQYHLDET
jgi:hypothetical protein